MTDTIRPPITERHARRSVSIVAPRREATERTASARILPLALTTAMESNRAFAVTTADRRMWIDPIHGSAVPVVDGSLEATRRAFFQSDPRHIEVWRERGVLSPEEVEERRWRHEVMLLLSSDKRRMTIFSRPGGQWLNPFSGNLEPSVTRDQGKITGVTVKAMAAVLARCPQAHRGNLLSREALRDLKMQIGYQDTNDSETTAWVKEN